MMPIAEEAQSGTLITFEEDENMEQAIISGIAFNRDEAKITVMGVPDRPGIAYAILGPIADANIDVDMIIQNASVEGHHRLLVHGAPQRLRARDGDREDGAAAHRRASIVGDNRMCKVSLVGVGMRSHAGIAEPDVPHAGGGGHQHPDDLHLGDQDLGRGRREVHGARRARAAQGLWPRTGRVI